MQERPLDLGKLLVSVAVRLHHDKKVPIELVQSIEKQCLVKGNELFLEFAIECLIENAVRSMEQKGKPGRLDIECHLLDNFVQASISDTGKGISQNTTNVLFRKPVDSAKGFGYGTYTTANILRAYRGNIKVAQTSSDGTRIEFWLPGIKR